MHASHDRVRTATLGFPRMGPNRELKKALESYWAGRSGAADLAATAADLRRAGWIRQRDSGIDHVPVNDFSLYDHMLDTAVMVGAIPDRYRSGSALDTYFAMARGNDHVAALEMTKWFDTNYHYIVPELAVGQGFEADTTKLLGDLAEAEALGIDGRPVIVGPLTFLLLAKAPLSLLPNLLGTYEVVLERLAASGASWVQIDEPALGLDLDAEILAAYRDAYARLAAVAPSLELLIATYFTGLRANLPTALGLPIAALHLDLVAAPEQLVPAVEGAPDSLALSLGLVDGRNVWRADLDAAIATLQRARAALGDGRVMVAPSSSLLHLPYDLDAETSLDPAVREWLAFAVQRLHEVNLIAGGEGDLSASRMARQRRASSPLVHDAGVRSRMETVDGSFENRTAPFPERRARQQERYPLPVLPTTTIGSFPQTAEVRSLRARFRKGELPAREYEVAMQARIADAVRLQAGLGMDVLVHGEFERNDMVEYFGEHLAGLAVTERAWVQSYGSRCVKPPIIYGDVSRPHPITVPWTSYAQSLTDRPVKGMLTGPVTILEWSFVRDDQPRSETCRQIALAVRDEVADLEAAGTAIIQIDEPALREGLPLHCADRPEYLAWAVAAFRLASSGVADTTQIHTHMCYGEFEDIIDSIIAFDADVISIEAARSGMDLLGSFTQTGYPNDIGPGIWDIHSPRVPSAEEFVLLIERAAGVFPVKQMWVNPDCGLKTRAWVEVEPALRHLVDAARQARATLAG